MNRRDFIQKSALGAILPTFLGKSTLWSLGNIRHSIMSNDNVLVVIQLSGGNDGLNTIIPINQYSQYKNARSSIAIQENKLLKTNLDDRIGIHPKLQGFNTLLGEGKAAIIQDVGYPNPNFSHFRATDIWQTGSDAQEYVESGWAGRYLGIAHANYPEGYPNETYPDPLAIQIGTVVNTALQGTFFNMGVAINQVSGFYELTEDKSSPLPDTLAGSELSFLREVSKQSNRYAGTIETAAVKVNQQKDYPNTNLASQLKIVARLIAGGLKTKIYFVKLGGFDTHADQVETSDTSTGNHAELLAQVSEAIRAFQNDLQYLKVSEKVLGMTYSEFGRRIKSNGSAGTDHGAAAPMFLFGDKVNPAYYGQPTPLADTIANDDNIVMQYDFRSVYASIMKYWFCVQDNEIEEVLFKNFQTLPLIQADVCGILTANTPEVDTHKLQVFPNPVVDFAMAKFQSAGLYSKLHLFNTRGQQVKIFHEGILSTGEQNLKMDLSGLKAGTYFLRLQNKSKSEVYRVIKM